jgi:hypothetical protein
MKKILFLLTVIILGFSCTVDQDVVVEQSGSGNSRVSVKLHPVMTAYLSDLTAMLGDVKDPDEVKIFEPEAMEYAFSFYEDMNLNGVSVPTRDSMTLTITFDDIGKVLASQEQQFGRLFSFKTEKGIKTIDIMVDQSVIRHVLSFSPAGKTMAQSLLPPEGYTFTKEEYIDYLEWPLEEYLNGSDLGKILAESFIHLELRVKGTIIRQEGGTVSGSLVRFRLPLLDAVTAESPITYSITFR